MNTIEMNNIYNMDCLEGMDLMINQGVKVDAIITDPPYNISRDNNFQTMGIAGIDFGEWDKGFDQFSWIDRAWDLIKDGGTLFIFNAWKNVGDIARYAESKGFITKDLIRWEKSNPMPRNRDRRYIVDFELAVWLVKPKGKWVFNRLSETYDRCEYNYPLTPPSERFGHPTAKPVLLMEEIIKRHTNTGQIILDPFMGSGTTVEACINTNRNYIGFEVDKKYYDTAIERIRNVEEEK